ncbi:hypothetical protein [uncultured Flavobacterium sp.]|uniref:hypothetical protein n=1 Tax=uncultured Flavobacterium sp. TaxID=165435 RepID=UPI0027E20E37|nr:hypothetical protein [uncultured Flavobacterium sp.]
MQPVKISIQGDFMDCQIYRGRLYLWTFDGKLKVYRWYDLINSLPNSERDALPLKFCFLDGNYLYKSDLVDLFHDEDFRKILLDKFSRLSNQHYELTEKEADRFLYGQQDTPSNLLATDTEIYSNSLYYINEQGLFSTSAHRDNKKYPVSSKPVKLWDCNLLSIKANKYPQLALSGGDEGLFEYDLSKDYRSRWNLKDPVQVSNKHSSFANYTYWSIYNTSLVESSYMALFDLNEVELDEENLNIYDFGRRKFKREFKEEISERRIFDNQGNRNFLSWGVDDKIYRATDGGFEIVKFKNNPNFEKGEEQFTRLQNLNLHAWKGKVIGGGTSYYGTILECENALVVLLSNGQSETIEGPITRWRVYPRSMNYQNHLHVIKDDRIEIYSFNQDYFLDQDEKLIGLEHKAPRKWSNS